MTAVVSTLNIHKGDDFALRQSLWIDSIATTPGGAAVAVTVPTNGKYVLFSANGDFYCLITPKSAGSAVAAVVPTTTTTNGSSSELNPAMRLLPDNGGSFFSVISPAAGATIITVQYFGLA
jgi:hypothetical protein